MSMASLSPSLVGYSSYSSNPMATTSSPAILMNLARLMVATKACCKTSKSSGVQLSGSGTLCVR